MKNIQLQSAKRKIIVENGNADLEEQIPLTPKASTNVKENRENKMLSSKMSGRLTYNTHKVDSLTPRSSSYFNSVKHLSSEQILAKVKSKFLDRQLQINVLDCKDHGAYQWTEMRRTDLLHEGKHSGKTILKKIKAAHEKSQNNSSELPTFLQLVTPREIRKIDPSFMDSSIFSEFAVLVRVGAIIIYLGDVRLLILSDRCKLIIPEGADGFLQIFLERLYSSNENLDVDSASKDDCTEKTSEKGHSLPFEFRALEAILEASLYNLRLQVSCLTEKIQHNLQNSKFSSNHQIDFVGYKRQRNYLEAQVEAILRALVEVLESDEDMAMMYMNRMNAEPHRALRSDFATHHDEIELLFESHVQNVRGVLMSLRLLRYEVEDTEKMFTMELAMARNRILIAETVIGTISMTLGIIAAIGGIFGMNLKSGVEDSEGWFTGVTLASVIISVIVTVVIIVILIKSLRMARDRLY